MENTENKALAVVTDDGFIGQLTGERKQSFCSFVAGTDEEKTKLFNGVNNPSKRISDCINETIELKDIYAEEVELVNEKTGEINTCPRIVLFDAKGESYVSVSMGIFSALKKLMQVFGTPAMWTKPLPVKVKQINKADKRLFTLEIVKAK